MNVITYILNFLYFSEHLIRFQLQITRDFRNEDFRKDMSTRCIVMSKTTQPVIEHLKSSIIDYNSKTIFIHESINIKFNSITLTIPCIHGLHEAFGQLLLGVLLVILKSLSLSLSDHQKR